MSYVMYLVILILIVLRTMSTPAWGAGYKCPDGKGGYVIRNMPCTGQAANAPFEGHANAPFEGRVAPHSLYLFVVL